jgi:hypothetical protein
MAVTPVQIQKRLGRPLPLSAEQTELFQIWIDEALLLINTRAAKLGVTLDPDLLDLVVARAVTAMARRPNDETQVDVSIDDGRVSKRYSSSTGQVTITDEWWDLLGLAEDSESFSITPTWSRDCAGGSR